MIFFVAALTAMAQNNKPEAGNLSVGFGYFFFAAQPQFGLAYMVSKKLEVGGSVGVGFNRTRNSTFDSIPVTTNNFTSPVALEEKRNVSVQATAIIAPLIKYHFDIKNNFDFYIGGDIPVGISMVSKTVYADIVTTNNFKQSEVVTSKAPVTITISEGLMLGARYFFIKNMAVGAEANLGFSSSISNGNINNQTTTSNAGSINPLNSNETSNSRQQVKSDVEGLSMMHSLGVIVDWYFGKGKQ